MYRLLSTFLFTILMSALANAQQMGPRGPVPAALKECQTANECILFGNESLAIDDYKSALHYTEKAAKMGSVEGQYKLGVLYKNGVLRRISHQLGPYDHDGHYIAPGPTPELAYTWFKIADLNGHDTAHQQLDPMWREYLQEQKDDYWYDWYSQEYWLSLRQTTYGYINTLIADEYASGAALPQDYKKALWHYRVGVAHRLDMAHLGMAKLYEKGLGVESDLLKAYVLVARGYDRRYREYVEALQAKLSAEELKIAAAQITIHRYREAIRYDWDDRPLYRGIMYEHGYDVEQSYELAREQYSKYVKNLRRNDVSEQISRYSNLLMKGLGGPVDLPTAYRWLLESKNWNFGVRGVDKEKMLSELSKDEVLTAAYQGNIDAQVLYANTHYDFYDKELADEIEEYAKRGKITLINPTLNENHSWRCSDENIIQYSWLKIAADAGDPFAIDRLESDYWRAKTDYGADGYNALGDYYADPRTTNKNYKKAIKYYEKSVALNNGGGYMRLGQMYELGLGVDQNYQLARRLYEKNIELTGHDDAILSYAKLLEKGLGGDVDLVGAYKWTYLLRAVGVDKADEYLSALEPKLTPDELEEAIRLGEELVRDY